MKVLGTILIIIAIFIGLCFFAKWSDGRDAQIEKAATELDDCMRATYHISASGYYDEHGFIPACAMGTTTP